MAGHSHYKNIKRKKEAEDKKRAQTFSKMSRLIISAVKDKGKNPETNPALRSAIEKAKEADMPMKNIERAIKRGAGEGEQGNLEPFTFEAYGPEGVALIIEGQTDNRNKTLNEIREILKEHGGKLADPGSITWMFDKKGIIETEKEGMDEKMTLEVIEKGAEDIKEKEESFLIYTSPENIKKIRGFLDDNEIGVIFAGPGWRPKTTIEPKKNSHKHLFEDLRESDFIEEIYTNT